MQCSVARITVADVTVTAAALGGVPTAEITARKRSEPAAGGTAGTSLGSSRWSDARAAAGQ